MKKVIKIVIIVCIIIIFIDQLSKYLVVKYSLNNFGNDFFKFELAENTGIAFGVNKDNGKNILLTILVLSVIISFFKNQYDKLDLKTTIAISIALGGGISNLIDRIF